MKPLTALLLVIAILALASLACITVEHQDYLDAANAHQQQGLPLGTVEVEP
jgi:hypothetical protein